MQHKEMKFRKVQPGEFDISTLQQFISNGQVYISICEDKTVTASMRKHAMHEIMACVDRISEYATNPRVREIWERILGHEELAPLFILMRYKKKRGQVNWYRAAVVLSVLREKGAYRQDISAMRLHRVFEGDGWQPKHYSGMENYLLDRRQLGIVRSIMD